ncbi:xanthine dehydrogenase family protein subunit M [Dactylosporangium fulvum]|uniref:FAD binding domain-containing protein n=1 Tax=Dactylosporangium fulvum TaxID=53359 RepID=UPI0031E0215E
MIPVAFDYVRPSTVEDAVAALSSAADEAKILAGGQSLLPVLRLRLAAPALLVDLGGLPGLTGVRLDGDALVIGAMTTHAEVASSPLVRQHAPLLAGAAGTVGDRQVRHRGTLGGSLAHADPAADLPAVAAALDAVYAVQGPGGRREIAAGDFSVDLFTTALSPDEVLVEVRLPSTGGWATHYEKFHRMAQAWAIVGVAVAVSRSGGTIGEARVALTNMGPVPHRARAVESALAGAPATAEAVAEACAGVAADTSAVDDLSASADYRRELARVLTTRAVCRALGV